MNRSASLVVAMTLLGSQAALWSQDNAPGPHKKLPDGVYAVLRDSLKEKDVLPIGNGEELAIQQHRYSKKSDKEPPRFLVVRSGPNVPLDLMGEPTVVKEGGEIVRILLKLRPKAATALEQLTRDRFGKQIAILLDGDVVTTHKIRTVIKGGEVQITNCAAGAADYLVKQLKAKVSGTR